MASSSSSSLKYVLKSSDGETFEIDDAVAAESETIKQLIECTSDGNVIPLPNITGSILAKVVEYCKKHAEIADKDPESKDCHSFAKLSIDEIDTKDFHPSATDDIGFSLKTWDAGFVEVDPKILFELVLAADYLNIKTLMDLTCTAVAKMLKEKTAEELCEIFRQ